MSLILQGIPSSLSAIVQDGTLERVFHDATMPKLLFRGEAVPDRWEANLGERMIFTRRGRPLPSIKPLIPGQDPVPRQYEMEQWDVTAAQYGDSNVTHMPTSYVTLASTFLSNTQQLGLGAALTMNTLTRNRLFASYLAGEAMVRATASASAFQVQVTTLNGFTERLLNGKLLPVSPGNPLPVTFSVAGEPANTVVGYTPNDPAEPLGSGVLTLSAALTVGLAARDAVYAATRARRLRVGGGATVDALSSTNILTLNDVIAGITRLRDQNIPPHADGRYHVHVTPTGEQQLFADNHWQRLHQSLPDSIAYRDLALGDAVGGRFYRNTENPSQANCYGGLEVSPGGDGGARLAKEIGAEVTNENGYDIRRCIITGGGVMSEKYLDESKFITEAGVMGKIGEFSIVNGGVAVMTQRIRYILRAPQDALQQTVTQSWSWSGDFATPSDALSGDTARHKRAVVIEHG